MLSRALFSTDKKALVCSSFTSINQPHQYPTDTIRSSDPIISSEALLDSSHASLFLCQTTAICPSLFRYRSILDPNSSVSTSTLRTLPASMSPAGPALNHRRGRVVVQQAMRSLCQSAQSTLLHISGVSRIRAIKAHSKNKRHAVLRVPPEIWDMIASYLPALSATCLALSCRSLYYHLGPQHWLQPKHNERIAFLAFLDPNNVYVLLNFPEHYYRNADLHSSSWKISLEAHCQASAQRPKEDIPFELWPSLTKHKGYLPPI